MIGFGTHAVPEMKEVSALTKFLDNCFAKLDKILVWALSILFGAMSVIIFMQVVWRYVLRSPLSWSEETARYLFVWVSFLGAITAARRGNHIGMEMLRDKLPNVGKNLLCLIANLICVLFFVLTCYYTISVAPRMWRQFSPALEISMFYPYLGIAVGSGFMALIYANEALKNIASVKGGVK